MCSMLRVGMGFVDSLSTLRPALGNVLTLSGLSSVQTSRFSTAPPAPASYEMIEVREYTVRPDGLVPYMAATAETADLRKKLMPFLGMFTCDVGGSLLKVTHMYGYKDFDERDEIRRAAVADPEWCAYVKHSRQFVVNQESKIMLQAAPVYAALGMKPTNLYASPLVPAAVPGDKPPAKVVYELRNYQLHPGYGNVPSIIEAFKTGLPDKVAADPEGQLVFFGHTDVGMLNNVSELWRYPSAQACIRARVAARAVPKWKSTIGAVTPIVQHFTSSFLHPTKFSPWQ